MTKFTIIRHKKTQFGSTYELRDKNGGIINHFSPTDEMAYDDLYTKDDVKAVLKKAKISKEEFYKIPIVDWEKPTLVEKMVKKDG